MTSGQFKVFKCHEIFYPLLTTRWDISHLKSLFSIREENHINSLFPVISPFSCCKHTKRFFSGSQLGKSFHVPAKGSKSMTQTLPRWLSSLKAVQWHSLLQRKSCFTDFNGINFTTNPIKQEAIFPSLYLRPSMLSLFANGCTKCLTQRESKLLLLLWEWHQQLCLCSAEVELTPVGRHSHLPEPPHNLLVANEEKYVVCGWY